jgi:Uma2 family endonuclease
MIVPSPYPDKPTIIYPESDGEPIAENTLQFQWIVTIQGGLDAMYRNDPNVFVAGDLLWYPVEGSNTIRQAPDTMVVFNRPKGYRGSYMQWLEDNIGPQVAFEVLSPGNRFGKMLRKFQFYERYGVEEYYIYDPDNNEMTGYLRSGPELKEIDNLDGWTSPRLQIRFELASGELKIYRPDGQRFATYVELVDQWEREKREKEQAQQQRDQAQQQRDQAQQQRDQAQQQRDQESREKEQARQRAERLAAQLRALGVDPVN